MREVEGKDVGSRNLGIDRIVDCFKLDVGLM